MRCARATQHTSRFTHCGGLRGVRFSMCCCSRCYLPCLLYPCTTHHMMPRCVMQVCYGFVLFFLQIVLHCFFFQIALHCFMFVCKIIDFLHVMQLRSASRHRGTCLHIHQCAGRNHSFLPDKATLPVQQQCSSTAVVPVWLVHVSCCARQIHFFE